LSFKSLTQPLRDILDGVNMIEEFTAGMDFEAFRTNPMAVAAGERKILTFGEAAVRLGREAPSIVPDIPWRQVRDLGNLLRHEYDKVDLAIIWKTVTDDLPELKAAVQRALITPPHSKPESPTPKQ
jgi:uncharacterized protein with HEPN domain